MFANNVVPGWTTTALLISLLALIEFTMLAFFGEYLNRLLDDKSGHDSYSVVFEKHSAVMVDADRINVKLESVDLTPNKVQTSRDK